MLIADPGVQTYLLDMFSAFLYNFSITELRNIIT